MNVIEHSNKSISILAKRNMGADTEHRFEACVYEDIWTRLTASVSRVYENLFILILIYIYLYYLSQPLSSTGTFDFIYFLAINEIKVLDIFNAPHGPI